MVSGAAEVGDAVVLVEGSPVPFVMRRAGDGGAEGEEWVLI